jgi:hypothetical protein
MLGQLKMSEGTKARYRSVKPSTTYKSPTEGLSHVVFEYGERMKPGSFKTMMESIAEHMAATLKHGGPEAFRAIKKAEAPTYREPDKPTVDASTRRGLLRFDKEWDQWWKNEKTWKENSGKIFEKLLSHCTPTMKTKLRGMEDWTDIEESQDGIKMVKLLHRVHFDTDGSKQPMREMVLADKKLYLCFQKKEWSLDEYTREFQARY